MQGSPINYFLSEIDKCKKQNIYFIGTTSSPEKIDVAMKKIYRFEKSISINCSGD